MEEVTALKQEIDRFLSEKLFGSEQVRHSSSSHALSYHWMRRWRADG
jgi:hypothetical protein